MLGRTPGAIQVIRPMREGVIADYVTTEAMLRYFIGRVVGRVSFVRPEVMICVPAGVTGVEQRAVQDAAEAAGARRPAHLIPEPLAAAIGARIPVNVPQGHMIVDIGGGRTEAAVISMYGIVVSESVRVAGDRLDDAIAAYVKRRHNLVVGDRTAEELKIAIGSALMLDDEMTYQVRGRDQITGLPRTITVSSTDVTNAIQDPLTAIVGAVRSVLERTPPELASDVVDRGIVLSGGTAMLRNLDRLITEEIGIPCYVADNPMECVAMGAGIALDHLDLIKRSMPPEGEWLVSF
jgi:rod shape-determining protein MreB